MNIRQMINKIPLPFIKVKAAALIYKQEEGYDNLTEDEFQSLMADTSVSPNKSVEVVYVTNEKQFVIEVQVPRGANIEDGIVLSGLLEQCNDINLSINKVGIYGVIKPLTEELDDGDRIEIYRPVTAKE